jgi:hypothetical protein
MYLLFLMRNKALKTSVIPYFLYTPPGGMGEMEYEMGEAQKRI